MRDRSMRNILVAEVTPEDGQHLIRCLQPFGLRVCLATTNEEVFQLLHTRIFRWAIVAAERITGREMLIARLACIPTIQYVIALGPAGDLDLEVRCRVAGAQAYLARPVNTGMLAVSLNLPIPDETAANTMIGAKQ
ncbi:MAG: hypothetical protein GXY44_09740 [Phycisphaerales bacterium]|nr:hypothetical protein [Phycisphaerales bacterium]